MLRILVAVILSLSIALPGVAMASPEHHSHQTSSPAAHGHHAHQHEATCENSDCELELVMMCCAMIAGHCISVGVLSDSNATVATVQFETAKLSPGSALTLIGQTFEADPPPPRA